MDAFRQVREVSHRMVEDGAIMAVGGSPATYNLIGAWRWNEDGRVMWFVAHGDAESDAHLLEFDRVQVVDTLGICFFNEDQLAGCLSPIAKAQVEDPDDYFIGWKIWKEVAPLYESLIARAFDRLECQPVPLPQPRERTPRASTVAA